MENQSLTKQNSQAIKGIAILLMLIHHLFYSTKSFGTMPVDFFFFDTEQVIHFARFAKICVPLFVFITAYGLTVKYKMNVKNRLDIEKITAKRLVSMMIPFWFIFVIAQIVCNCIGIRTYSEIYGTGKMSILFLIIDALGLANCFHTATLNVTWWYMSLALLLIFIMPFLWKTCTYVGWTILLGTFILFRAAEWSNTGYFNYIFIAILGIVAADLDIFAKISTILYKRHVAKLILFVLSLGLLFFCLLLNTWGGYQDVVFFFSVISIVFIEVVYISKLKWIEKVFSFLGKHSMNIFLIHTFIKTYFLHDFIYSFKYGVLIFFALLSSSLVVSIVINLLQRVLYIEKLITIVNLKTNNWKKIKES